MGQTRLCKQCRSIRDGPSRDSSLIKLCSNILIAWRDALYGGELPFSFLAPFSVEDNSLRKEFRVDHRGLNHVDLVKVYLLYMHCTYSRLSLSRSRGDPLKHFEISVLRHIRFAELRKIPIEQQNFSNEHVI